MKIQELIIMKLLNITGGRIEISMKNGLRIGYCIGWALVVLGYCGVGFECSYARAGEGLYSERKLYELQGNEDLIFRETGISKDKRIPIFKEIDGVSNARDLIKYMGSDDSFVLRRVIYRLGELGTRDASNILVDLWGRRNAYSEYANNEFFLNPLCKAALARQLVKLFGDKYVSKEYLFSMLDSKNYLVRADAVDSMGYFSDVYAVKKLMNMLSDSEHFVAIKAISSIERIAEKNIPNKTTTEFLVGIMIDCRSKYPDVSRRCDLLLKKLKKHVK